MVVVIITIMAIRMTHVFIISHLNYCKDLFIGLPVRTLT